MTLRFNTFRNLIYFILFQQRTKEVIKMPTIDIAVPMHLRKIKPTNQNGKNN